MVRGGMGGLGGRGGGEPFFERIKQIFERVKQIDLGLSVNPINLFVLQKLRTCEETMDDSTTSARISF